MRIRHNIGPTFFLGFSGHDHRFCDTATSKRLLLLFVVLAFGLLLGKVRFGNFQIGNTIGVLFTALLFGQMGFEFTATTENVGSCCSSSAWG